MVDCRQLSFESKYHNLFIGQPTIFKQQLIAKPIWVKRANENQVIMGDLIWKYLKMDTSVMADLSEIKAKVAAHMGATPVLPDDHGSPDNRRLGQDLQTEKEVKEKTTHRLIVEVAERLFRQLGFQKTTVADIARELNMSPANVYRFFSAKSEINAAVCRDLLGKIEVEGEKIAATRGSAAQRLQNLLASVERAHHKRYMSDRKLHELVEVAITENWSIMNEHNRRMAAIVEQIIASGMAAGEFRQGDATVAAHLVNTACIRFCHPRLMVEYDQKPEPTLNQMIGFCLAALNQQPN
jgi:AcrR family transcriptional regulator